MKSVDFINNGVGKGYICPTCFDMYEWSDDGSCSCDIKKKSFNAPDGDKPSKHSKLNKRKTNHG